MSQPTDHSPSQSTEYVLGTDAAEFSRLAVQHRLWADATTAIWKKAGIGPGARVLDLGCGPGFASQDLAQLVTHTGSVVAFDESPSFGNYVTQVAKQCDLPQLISIQGSAETLELSFGEHDAASFDVVYCRWILCWLPHPEKAIAGIRRLLKPNGRLIIHDYFNWKAMCLAPRSKALEKLVLAALESFEERHGNVDIAEKIPAILRAQGYRIGHFDVHQRVARGGGLDGMIAWPVQWWRTYGQKLVDAGRFSLQDFKQVQLDLLELEHNPDHFFFCPPLFEFIAHIAPLE